MLDFSLIYGRMRVFFMSFVCSHGITFAKENEEVQEEPGGSVPAKEAAGTILSSVWISYFATSSV